jgi:hypothetical protein
MNLRKLTLASLFLAIGVLLHYIMPGLPGGMKPDSFLAMMFIAIMICDDYKMITVIGFASGILTALTTTFPAGQVPNIIDKIVTTQILFVLLYLLRNRVPQPVKFFIIAVVGTLISGTVFLGSAQFLVGLPQGTNFNLLFSAVVIPATIANTVMVFVLGNIINLAIKRTSYNVNL